MTSTLNGANQITLPDELLKELHLEPGSQIEWSTTEDGALLGRRLEMTRDQLVRHLLGRGRKYLRLGDDPVRELIEDRVREDEEEGLAEPLLPAA